MTEKNYIDMDGMQARVDEENRKKSEQFHERLRKSNEHREKEQAEINELFDKAMKSEREETEAKRAIEIEKEKAKAIAEVEAKYESIGIQTDYTKKKDDDLRNMLRNLRGMPD